MIQNKTTALHAEHKQDPHVENRTDYFQKRKVAYAVYSHSISKTQNSCARLNIYMYLHTFNILILCIFNSKVELRDQSITFFNSSQTCVFIHFLGWCTNCLQQS